VSRHPDITPADRPGGAVGTDETNKRRTSTTESLKGEPAMKKDETRQTGLPPRTGLDPAWALAAALAAVAGRPSSLADGFRLLAGRLEGISAVAGILADGLAARPADSDPPSPTEAAAIRMFVAPVADAAQILALVAYLDSMESEDDVEESMLLDNLDQCADLLANQAGLLREQLDRFMAWASAYGY
jgi:hypothetical protein